MKRILLCICLSFLCTVLYAQQSSTQNAGISITADTDNDNEDTSAETESNMQVINQLAKAGDSSAKPRMVQHAIYFKTTKDRSEFIKLAVKKNFKVNGMETSEDKTEAYPYSLRISNISDVRVETMNKTTHVLRTEAANHNGDYDGWGAPVTK